MTEFYETELHAERPAFHTSRDYSNDGITNDQKQEHVVSVHPIPGRQAR